MSHAHLTDDQLIGLCVTGQGPLLGTGCASCDARRAELRAMLDEVSATADAEFEKAFTPDRIARQYARIVQRLEQQGRLGRVIAFPLGQARRASLLHPRPIRRWVAGAAAAGLVIGVAAGHFAHQLTGYRRPTPPASQQSVRANTAPAPLPRHAVPNPSSDDEFLRELELAVGSAGPAALRRLEALTPVVWELP